MSTRCPHRVSDWTVSCRGTRIKRLGGGRSSATIRYSTALYPNKRPRNLIWRNFPFVDQQSDFSTWISNSLTHSCMCTHHECILSQTHNDYQTFFKSGISIKTKKWYCSQSNSKYLHRFIYHCFIFLWRIILFSDCLFHCTIYHHWKNTGYEAYTTIATVNGILLSTHVAHCSLRLRITDNSGMSKTRFSGMYFHACWKGA